MTITTLSSRAFNQEISKAKKLSKNGPVYIADRGKPAYVLLSWEAFKKLGGSRRNILVALQMPETADVEFEPERGDIINRDVDF